MHLLTQSALLQALGWTLVNSLWQMGLLWLTWWLVAGLFPAASSRFRHSLALALLAFGVLGSIGTFIDAYFLNDGGFVVPGAGGWVAGSRLFPLILPYCSSLYLLLLAVLLVRYGYQYSHSRRLTREGLSKMPAGFRVFVEATGRRMGIRPAVRVYLSSLVEVPLTLGFWKPVILLPLAILSQLSIQQVEAILVHELAHIRRKDYLLHLLVSVIGLLYFFNPFARLLIRHLQREREHCCDEEVLQFRYDPHAYVSALLSVARQYRQGRIALAATGGGGEQFLLQRARNILRQKATDRRPGFRPFLFLFLTAAVSILGLSSPTKKTRRAETASVQPAVPFNAAALAASSQRAASHLTATRPAASQPAETRPATSQPLPTSNTANSGNANTATRPAAILSDLAMAPIVNTPSPAVQRTAPEARPGNAAHRAKQSASSTGDDPQDLSDARLLTTVASAPGSMTLILAEPATLTITGAPARRDNSLGRPDADEGEEDPADNLPPMENLVFVPNSSFSFQQFDTLRPAEKLAMLEAITEKQIRTQVARLQKELEVQIALLRREEARTRSLSGSTQRDIKQLLDQQLQLQRDYLRKLNELNTRLQKAARHLTTVYI